MDISETVTSIIRENHASPDMAGVLIGDEIPVDEISATLFEVNPNVTTRTEAENINEIVEWAKGQSDDYVNMIKSLAYSMGFQSPQSALKRIYEYMRIKKSITNANQKLEAIVR